MLPRQNQRRLNRRCSSLEHVTLTGWKATNPACVHPSTASWPCGGEERSSGRGTRPWGGGTGARSAPPSFPTASWSTGPSEEHRLVTPLLLGYSRVATESADHDHDHDRDQPCGHGRQRKRWMDNIKEWTFVLMSELLTMASCIKDWKRIFPESAVVFSSPSPPPSGQGTELNELNGVYVFVGWGGEGKGGRYGVLFVWMLVCGTPLSLFACLRDCLSLYVCAVCLSFLPPYLSFLSFPTCACVCAYVCIMCVLCMFTRACVCVLVWVSSVCMCVRRYVCVCVCCVCVCMCVCVCEGAGQQFN